MASLYDDLYSAPATVESAKTSLLDDLGLEPAEGLGITGTLKEGAKSAGRAIGAAANAYTGDNQGIVDKAEAQQQAPKDYRLDKFYGDFADRTAALGDNPGVLETIGEGAGAIWDNPAGAGLAVVEQLPNAVPALAGGFAGMKAGAAGGAALGSVVAPGPGTAVGGAVGGVVGGLAGMFLGNTAIETGHKAMAMADDGAVTDAERSQAISEGAIKGGVITGVDALTLGAGGKLASALQRTTSSAMESATRKVLLDRGVDLADNAAVQAARGNPEIATAVRAAQESARQVTDKFGKRLAVGGTLLGMETVGEGVGEYLGELAATGEGNVPDAVLESLLSLGQSGAETAWNMARKSPSQGLWVQPQPSASNPAPAPIAAPNPEDGVLSRSVLAALPAPSPRLGLPAPESVLYADGQGTVSDQGPARNVDREYRPTGRERDPRTFGAGMDQQTERGAVPGREGDYIPVSRFASQQVLASNTIDGQLAPEPRGLPAPQRLLADGRADAGFIETNAAGESRQAKAGNVPPRDYVPQGGRGMDQQTPVGKKYTGMPAARKALRESANPAAMEVVKVGKKLFEVRAKPVDGGASKSVTAPSAVQFAAGQRWQHQGRTYNVNKVQADGRASVSTPSGSQAFVIRPEQAAAEGWTQDTESNGSPLSANGTPVTAQPAQKKARKVDRERDSVAHAVIRLGGITTNYRQDTTGEAKGNTNIPGVGSLWSDKTGTSIDDMASLLDQHGYIPQGEMASDGGVSWLQAALGDQLAGRKEHFAPGSKRQEEQALKIEADRAAARAAQYTDRDAEIDALIDANFDLADDTEAAEKRRIATEKFAAELDELFGDSNEPASTQESVTGAEQSYDQAAGADQSVDRRDGSEQRDQGEGVAAAGSTDSAPAFDLAAQTEASAAADAKEQDERNKADAAAQRKADEAKKKADDLAYIKQQSQATADNFTLGQNAEDSVTGQGGMFDSQPSLSELSGKPASQTPIKDAAPAVTEAQGDASSADQIPAKWFGTRTKAETHIKLKKKQATHEVIEVSATRFEVREKAEPVGASQAVQDFIDGNRPDAPTTAEVEAEQQARPEKPAVSGNTIFTDDAAEEARALIRSMLNGSQLNSGVDPRLFQAGITLAGYHIEKGARTFAAYAKAMLADMGDGVKPYLKQWYMGVKYDPRATAMDGMSSAAVVDSFSLDDMAGSAPSAPASTGEQPAASSLMDLFYGQMIAGTLPSDNRQLRKMVGEFDGKEADNARLKEAQEDLEAAIARRARDLAGQNKGDAATFRELLALYGRQPNLNIRTSTSIGNQAYSTPAPLAYLAARLADIDRSSSVYEPTAGNGMLLMTAEPKNATANELDDQRFNNLQALGFDAMQGDALQVIESGALAERSQDAIITNPPFGSIKDASGSPTKISVDGYKIGQIDHLIAAEALKAMKDDGKATLILGANKVAGGVSTDDRIFFNWLYSNYNVTGHFEVDGALYTRQGASWPVRIITLNGRAESSNISPKQGVTQRVNSWEAVYEQYEQVLGAQLAKPDFTAGGGKPNAATDDAAAAPATAPGQVKASGGGSGRDTSAGRPANVGGTPAGTGNPGGNGKPGALASGNPQQRPDAAAPQPDRLEQAGAAERPDGGSGTTQGTKPGKPAGKPVGTGENAFQTAYVPRAARKDEGVLIPVNMAQPMQDALSSLEDAVGDIDRFVMRELGYPNQAALDEALMGLQVDSVAASIYQMKNGKGVVIADQTGIGKGRQAAAIIRWAERSGKVPVFVTMKAQLFSDMHGDLLDIGSDNIAPLLMNSDGWIKTAAGQKLFANKPSAHKKVLEGVSAAGELPEGSNALFLTYSQINKPNLQRRVLRALADNAIFVLDESHNAGGESQTGEFMRELLAEAAGVTYLSATYAKRPDNMPLYFKTDIGDAISDSGNLMDAMNQGGLPLQTVVSNNLVKAGQMFRRERSYDGVSIETEVDTGNREAHERMSDAATSALRAIVKADKAFHAGYVQSLKDEIEAEGGSLEDVAGNQASESVDHTEFSSVVHNFIRQMLLGIKADTAAERAIEALKRGEKPLIALENTMGSFLSEYAEANGLKAGDSLGTFDYRAVLSRALERSRYIKKTDAMGNEEKFFVPLGELDFITRDAYEEAQATIDALDIDIPVSPLDWIRHRIEKAGYSVAEITGRDKAVDYSARRPKLANVPASEQTDKVGTTQRFNSGELDAIILNVSGSTGISLHASEKFKDQRKRLMIVAQPAQDINVFMQMLGRTHRTGQVQVPAYLILNADLPAEKRPTALLNGKMKSLNANTSSNTESATSIKSQDMLNKYGDQVVSAYLQDNIELARMLDIKVGSADDDGTAEEGIARKVTGRMALMPVADQKTFYAEIEEQYSSLIDYLNDSNQNELLPRTFDFEAELAKEATLVEATNPGTPFGQEAVYGEYKIKAQGKQMTPAEIRAEMDKNLDGVDGAAHAAALVQSLKQLNADTLNQERRENGLGATFDRAKYHAWLTKRGTEPAYAQELVEKAQRSYDAGIPAGNIKPEDVGYQSAHLSLITEHRIGSAWRVEINGDIYNAVIVNVRSSHKKSGNPFSPSKLQIQLAVNGPLRTITVPGSQWSKIEVAPLYGLSIDNAFRDQVEGSQTAKIITGNLLAAYGEIKDSKTTIISFTKKDGSIEQGILLPKKFDYKTNTRGDYQFRSAEDVATFLGKSDDPQTARFGVASRDAVVRIKPSYDGVVISVPKSKARGGKYFLDKNLLGITGDFVSDGNFMQVRVSKAQSTKAIEWLMRKAPLYAMPSQVEEARQVLGLPPLDNKDDAPRFSRSAVGATLTTLGRGDVEQITARLVTEAAVARRFVFSSWEELPQAIKDRAAAQGAKPGEIKAVHWQGKTYLVDRRFTDAGDVERTIFHEYYAHYGLRQQYGKDLHRKLLSTWAKVGGTKGVRAMAAEQGFNIDHYIEGAKQDKELTEAQRRVLIMDELLAHMAESTGSLKRLIQEWYGAVRDWLRGNGWAELAKLNAADLAFMLRGARQAALRADGGSVSGQPLFQRVESANQTSTVAFKRWFGESKVVDKQGAPKILYHGTGEDFTSFDQGRSGSSTRHSTAPLGIFMTGDRDTAQAYADKASDGMPGYARVMQLYAAIRNPYLMSVAESQAIDSPGEAVAFRAKLEREGYDGINLKGTDTWIAFSNTQMKSATDNNGEFDEWSGDIRFRRSARDLFDRATGPAPLDRNDPFAAENRRLREDDKTLWAKAKKVFARQFAPGGLLPDAVFAEKITRDSEFQAVEFDVRHLSGGLNQAVKADFGVDLDNLTPEQMKPLAEALTGKVDPSIPEATRVAIVAMRQYIDSLSGEYLSILQKQVELNMEGADQALIDKITGNLGAYVNRSYQAFDDPKWFKTVPTETVNAARTYLAKGYMEQGETPAEAARLADVTVNEMLKNGTAYDSMGGFIAESKLGAKDLTVLIKRKDIAPEIRALLGEYMDPRLNFAKSATKMGRMVWNQRFLDRVLEFGMGTLFFKGKDRPADATTQIAGEQSESYAPLNGLWTFPEVAQSFQDALGKEQMSDLYRTVVRLNGMVKYGKTILSPTTAMRNWQSAMFFSLANGHFDMSQMKKSWSAFREQVTQNATGDDLAYLRKLKQLGVVYDTPYAGEMMALMDDARMDELLSSKSGTGLKWLRKANQFAQGFYSFGDDFWKIIGYENEKASLIAAGIPEAQAETMAAERIRNTYPTYSMIGKAVQWLRRFPLAGTFVSFPSEIIRTTVNMMKLTAADLKSDNPGIRAIGRKRAAGMAMVSAGFYALSAMTAAALGVGDDEEEALRDLAAPWSKNSTFLYAGRDADGKLRYFDMSFLDPYGYWKRPLTAMMRDQPWEQAAASGISDMLSPFFGADITAGAIFEVLANKKPTGGQVYNENAGSVDQLQDISNHMRKALQPGFVSNGERLWLAGSDARREGSGQPYDMRDEVVSLLGWRSATLDTQTGLYYRSFDFTDALADAKKTLTRTLRSSNDVSEGDIRESKQAANAQYQKAFTEMGRLISSAGTAGMSRGEIVQTLKLSGVSQRNILALISGRVPPIDIGVHTQAKAVKQARVMRDGEHAAEIARRFRLAREQ